MVLRIMSEPLFPRSPFTALIVIFFTPQNWIFGPFAEFRGSHLRLCPCIATTMIHTHITCFISSTTFLEPPEFKNRVDFYFILNIFLLIL